MKILVIGSGGREHALVKAFRLSPLVTELHVIPGSDGMAKDALCHPEISAQDHPKIIDFCIQDQIDFVMIGPEDPLVAGLSDRLRERGIHCVGPDREAAQLEGSKIFSKQFMSEAGLPTAPFQIVSSVDQVVSASSLFSPPYVLKADGLCGGKGVFVCETLEDLKSAARNLFEEKIFGAAGSHALLEQFLPGTELSYLILTNGHEYQALPLAQDHKRLKDGDQGPNTGGMGTVAPLQLDPRLYQRIVTEILEPTVRHLDSRQFLYRGVLFIGIMVTARGPQILEFNVRFGDPETQVILPLLDGDLAQVFFELAKGELIPLKTKKLSAACVVMSAEGYPLAPRPGDVISGLPAEEDPNSWVLHAGTRRKGEDFFTQGGRVLNCIGLGTTLHEAAEQAYRLASSIHWTGAHYRKDIGTKSSKF
ncbi:MAG: phosphoribosylamine--glycine ligase [Bdellovibrionales bacterium]